MKPVTKRQVTIPRIPKKATATSRGRLVVDAMRRAPKPKRGMTTDQLMALTRGE